MHRHSVQVSSSLIATTLLLAAIVAFSGGIWFAEMQQRRPTPALDQKNANASFDNRLPFRPLSNHILLPTPSLTTNELDGNDNEESDKDRKLHYLVDVLHSQDDGFLLSDEPVLDVLFRLIDSLEIGPALSKHCHEPVSLGISVGVHCIVMLQKLGHVGILTSPNAHTIYLDILTEDLNEDENADVLSIIHSTFAELTGHETSSAPMVRWLLLKRGFDSAENAEEVGDIDLYILGSTRHQLKQPVAQEMSDFQSISVFNIIDPKIRPGLADHTKSLRNDGSYQSLYPDLFRPDRIIYLDGILQSRLMGEAAYHEALVHPAMLMHPNPKRVVIIGGGEGATLREVLKHSTVEHVAMIDIDKRMVEICIKYLPEWNSCGNLVGSAPSCFNDPRADIFYEDAVAWFLQRFRDEDTIDESQRYDVVIMDALDPNSETPFSDVLYSNADFAIALSSSLNVNGVLVSQTGTADLGFEVGYHLRKKTGVAMFTSLLKKYGFGSVDIYEETHGGFLAPWSFLIALKDVKERSTRWDSNQAMLDLELQWRLMRTNDESGTPLSFVDGATVMGYQFPSRTSQNTVCRSRPTPSFCSGVGGLDPERPHAPSQIWRVVTNESSTMISVDAPTVALLAQANVSKGSFLAVDARVGDFVLSAKTMNLIARMFSTVHLGNNLKMWEAMASYINKYATLVGNNGEYSVATSSISMLLSRQAPYFEDGCSKAVDSETIPFRRNAQTAQTAVWTTASVEAGENITAEVLGRHLFLTVRDENSC